MAGQQKPGTFRNGRPELLRQEPLRPPQGIGERDPITIASLARAAQASGSEPLQRRALELTAELRGARHPEYADLLMELAKIKLSSTHQEQHVDVGGRVRSQIDKTGILLLMDKALDIRRVASGSPPNGTSELSTKSPRP